MTRIPYRRPRRRALASLELALALPFLAFMAAAIFKVAEAYLSKTDTALKARSDGWKGRDEALEKEARPLPDETLFRVALQLDGKPGQGVTDETKTHTVHLPPVSHGSADVGTRLVVLQGTWDHQSLDFPDRSPLSLDERALFVAAVGKLPPDATQVDVNALGVDPESFRSQLDPSRFGLGNMLSGHGDEVQKMLEKLVKKATGLDQYDGIINLAKDPSKLIGMVSNLGKLGEAIDKLGDASDDLKSLGQMFGDMAQGVQALQQDLGVDSPVLQKIASVGQVVSKATDVASRVTKPLKDVRDFLKNPIPKIKLPE